jgi:hypothetical protein
VTEAIGVLYVPLALLRVFASLRYKAADHLITMGAEDFPYVNLNFLSAVVFTSL